MEKIFDLFWNIAGYVQSFGHFPEFVHNFIHISKKNQKFVPQIFRHHIEVHLDQISAS